MPDSYDERAVPPADHALAPIASFCLSVGVRTSRRRTSYRGRTAEQSQDFLFAQLRLSEGDLASGVRERLADRAVTSPDAYWIAKYDEATRARVLAVRG